MIQGVRRFYEQDLEVKKKFYSRDRTKTVRFNSNYDLYESKAANWRDTLAFTRDAVDHESKVLPQVCSYLIASMGLQVIWSFVLALLDAYSLMTKKALHNPVLVSLFVVGDWVTATLSLAAASASAGITVLYFSDLSHCNFGEECQKYQMAVAFAYLSWVTIAISSLIMLWLLAAG